MQQNLIRQESLIQHPQDEQGAFGSFREFRKEAGSFGNYQKRLFILMGCYWITASFFLILPFYFFKRPQYCLNHLPTTDQCVVCLKDCITTLCEAFSGNIKQYIIPENTLTYQFNLYCGNQPWRIFYKICPESFSFIGLLIYGSISDKKGRKVAFKISWRFYTIGLVLYSSTQTQFLITLGYFVACVNCFASLVIQFVLLFEQIDRSLRLWACYLLLSFLLVAPLLATFLAGYLVQIGLKVTITVLCTIPAIILSLATNFLEESSIFAYKDNKLLAFNIINNIAKINKLSPITIDLSRSCWRKYDNYSISIWDAIQYKSTRNRLFMSLFLMFTLFFNNRLAQISLDQFTNEYLRGTIMNGTSAFATITVIILITKYKVNKFIYLALPTCAVVIIDIILTGIDLNGFISESILSILLRYLSDLSYSIFLIWTIEAFPTVCRTQCLALALCGSSLGVISAYSLSSFPLTQLCISLVLCSGMILCSKHLQLDYQSRLTDTLSDQFYDQNDNFKRV